jgi:hypothetical protein
MISQTPSSTLMPLASVTCEARSLLVMVMAPPVYP